MLRKNIFLQRKYLPIFIARRKIHTFICGSQVEVKKVILFTEKLFTNIYSKKEKIIHLNVVVG